MRDKLYHAVARVHNVLVPGKTGRHLSVSSRHPYLCDETNDLGRGAAHVSFGGEEHIVHENYEILSVFKSVLDLPLM